MTKGVSIRLKPKVFNVWPSALATAKNGRGILRRAPRLLAMNSIGPCGVKKVVLWREGVAAS